MESIDNADKISRSEIPEPHKIIISYYYPKRNRLYIEMYTKIVAKI